MFIIRALRLVGLFLGGIVAWASSSWFVNGRQASFPGGVVRASWFVTDQITVFVLNHMFIIRALRLVGLFLFAFTIANIISKGFTKKFTKKCLFIFTFPFTFPFLYKMYKSRTVRHRLIRGGEKLQFILNKKLISTRVGHATVDRLSSVGLVCVNTGIVQAFGKT
jgi:hypothetical protein